MHTVVHAALQSTSFDSYAYADVRRMRFAPNYSTSPVGAVGSSYEDYSVTKDTEEKLKYSGKASRDQVLLQATVWEARQCLSLFRRCVKPYVYAVFLQLPCESIPPRQRFHLADKLITAREFNAHVRPARTKYVWLQNPGVRVQYACTILMTKFASRALYTVPRVHVQSKVYFGL